MIVDRLIVYIFGLSVHHVSRRGLPVSTAVAALLDDITDQTSFFDDEQK